MFSMNSEVPERLPWVFYSQKLERCRCTYPLHCHIDITETLEVLIEVDLTILPVGEYNQNLIVPVAVSKCKIYILNSRVKRSVALTYLVPVYFKLSNHIAQSPLICLFSCLSQNQCHRLQLF